ncbi:MAG: tetratricopeptide repeat protein [Planctomycetes bacterium]|nr:tetratricopeptide repeat protein [Planctomycetota bacterium]
MKTTSICGLVLAVAAAAILIGCGAPTTEDIKIQAMREYNAGQFDKCKPKFQTVLDSYPTDPDCLYYMARLLHMEGKLDRAIFHYRCCLDSCPAYPMAAYYLKAAELDAKVQQSIDNPPPPAEP